MADAPTRRLSARSASRSDILGTPGRRRSSSTGPPPDGSPAAASPATRRSSKVAEFTAALPADQVASPPPGRRKSALESFTDALPAERVSTGSVSGELALVGDSGATGDLAGGGATAPPTATDEARAHARDSFHELDKNDDGHVSRSELIRALRLPKNAYLCEVGV